MAPIPQDIDGVETNKWLKASIVAVRISANYYWASCCESPRTPLAFLYFADRGINPGISRFNR